MQKTWLMHAACLMPHAVFLRKPQQLCCTKSPVNFRVDTAASAKGDCKHLMSAGRTKISMWEYSSSDAQHSLPAQPGVELVIYPAFLDWDDYTLVASCVLSTPFLCAYRPQGHDDCNLGQSCIFGMFFVYGTCRLCHLNPVECSSYQLRYHKDAAIIWKYSKDAIVSRLDVPFF